jgi:hypothetical protein
MGKPSVSMEAAPGILVPRFVRGLEAYARQKGFAVSISASVLNMGYARGEETHLVGEWRGTKRQFHALKFTVPSFSLPTASCTKAIIAHRLSPIRAGRIDVESKAVLFEPDL